MFINSSVVQPAPMVPTAAGRIPPAESTPLPDQKQGSGVVVLRSSDTSNINQTKDDAQSAHPDAKTKAGAQDAVSMSQEDADQLAKELERAFNNAHTQVKFRVDPKAGPANSVSFTVTDSNTGKVIREFPPKAVGDLAEGTAIRDGQGIFVDEPKA